MLIIESKYGVGFIMSYYYIKEHTRTVQNSLYIFIINHVIYLYTQKIIHGF